MKIFSGLYKNNTHACMHMTMKEVIYECFKEQNPDLKPDVLIPLTRIQPLQRRRFLYTNILSFQVLAFHIVHISYIFKINRFRIYLKLISIFVL